MADSKLFMIPFGASGDRAAIPDTVAPSGAVSWPQGFGPDYERDPAADPMAKRVPRDETNEYLYQITNAIKFLQLYGVPEWFAVDGSGAAVSYPLGARVRYDAGGGMKMWRSLSAANVSGPGSDFTKWTPYEEGSLLGVRRFTASGAYTPTPGTQRILVEVVGAGGGGGGARATVVGNAAGGAGGGGGGYASSLIAAPPSPIAVSVGVGGVAGIGANVGQDGTVTSFGSLLSASGGAGGGGTLGAQHPTGFVVQAIGGVGGVGSGGNVCNSRGGPGGTLLLTQSGNNRGGSGGSCFFGFGPLGGAGSNANGVDGGAGCGGSGAIRESTPSEEGQGGRGGDGMVIIYEYA